MPRRRANRTGDKVCPLTFRVDPATKQWIGRVVKNLQVRFTSDGELLRWCLREGLKSLSKEEVLNPDFMAEWAIYKSEAMIGEQLEREDACINLLENTRQWVKHFLRTKNWDEMITMLQKVKAYLEAMPKKAWSQRFLDQWNKEFGQYVDATKTAETKPNGKPAYDFSRRVSLRPQDAQPD